MKKAIFNFIYIILLIIVIGGCRAQTKYITVKMSSPPKIYIPNNNITTDKQLLEEYLNQLIKITEWQKWYNIQIKSNYYQINDTILREYKQSKGETNISELERMEIKEMLNPSIKNNDETN